MSKLVTFGCSCTFGQALDDCIITDWNADIKPSKFAWPEVLSNLMKLECDNRAQPGYSNLQILDTILSTNINQDDTVIVMWSYIGRDMIIDDAGIKHRIHSSDETEIVKYWASTHTITDLMYRSWVYMHHASLYLKSLGVKFYFVQVLRDSNFLSMKPEWAQSVSFLDVDVGKCAAKSPKAADNAHPGTQAHALIAHLIYLKIKNRVRTM
jgi:hypothetical protein